MPLGLDFHTKSEKVEFAEFAEFAVSVSVIFSHLPEALDPVPVELQERQLKAARQVGRCSTRFDTIRHDSTRFDTIRHDSTRFDTIRHMFVKL